MILTLLLAAVVLGIMNLIATLTIKVDVRPSPEHVAEVDQDYDDEPEWKRARRSHGWHDDDFDSYGHSA